MPRDFDMWNTREKNLSQSPRKAFQERLMLVYLVFTCYWRQICCTQLSKPSPKLRSWAPLLVYDATVWVLLQCCKSLTATAVPRLYAVPHFQYVLRLYIFTDFKNIHYFSILSIFLHMFPQHTLRLKIFIILDKV